MFERRNILKLGLGGLAAGIDSCCWWGADPVANAAAAKTAGFALAAPQAFRPSLVVDAARAAAQKPYAPPPHDLPDSLRHLSYQNYRQIHAKPEAIIWANENLGFAVEPLQRGFIFSSKVQIYLVSQGQARRLVYSTSQFDFGKLAVPNLGDIGFSGFNISIPRHGQGKGRAEIARFQGASFFRARARDQRFGTMARALSIRTADPRGEEFPAFRTFWIEQPNLATNALVIHALIDSQSVAGAYRFTLHADDTTIIDTECTLFARKMVDNFGIATMSATVLTDAIDHRRPDDIRPRVADIGGLQMLTGQGEWLWRPVSNRETLQISTFVDKNPRGFGFLQRDRNFDDYQDDVQHWELRPSLWIEPIGKWDAGGVELVEIPGNSESNDNIIAYWRPHAPFKAKSEVAFAYRQFWCWAPPQRPPLAIVTDTRSGRGTHAKQRRFLVEFTGETLVGPLQSHIVKPVLSVAPGTIVFIRQYPIVSRKVCRVLFEIDPGSATSSELRLVLEAAGQPLSETWLYRWTH